MIVFPQSNLQGTPLSLQIVSYKELNYEILLKIFPVRNAMQLNIVHCIALVLFYIELLFIYLMLCYIKSKSNFSISLKDFIFVGGLEAIYLLIRFNSLPYWVDDDKTEEIVFIEQPLENSLTETLTEIVNKDIENIHYNQSITEFVQKTSKNTGGKNTELTMNVANNFDLKNNTIVLPNKSKKIDK